MNLNNETKRKWWLKVIISLKKHLDKPSSNGYFIPPAEKAVILFAVKKLKKEFYDGSDLTETMKNLNERYHTIQGEIKKYKAEQK